MRFVRPLLLALLASAALAACSEPPASDPDTGDDPTTEDPADAGSKDAAPDASLPPVTFRLMTWNAHNFFDDKDDPAKQDDILSTTAMNTEVAQHATVVKQLKPDILALQEIENVDMLNRLCDALKPTLDLPNRVLIEAKDPRGIDVALASKYKITKTVSHVGERLYTPDQRGPYYYSRDNLEVHLDVDGREVVVLVEHQISKLDSSDDYQRQAQANGARQLFDALRKEKPTRPVIIVGDMNDELTTTACTSTCGTGLVCAAGFCMGSSLPVFFTNDAITDVGADVPATDRWTEEYQRHKQRIDFILPDKTTAESRTGVQIPHSGTLATDILKASDHFPVVANFTIR